MGVIKEQKSALGPSIILVVLLIDVGLVVWGWNLYQRRQERLDDAGLNFARAPAPTPAAPAVASPEPDQPPTGIDRYVVKESLGPSRPPAPASASPAAARPAAPAPAAAASPEGKLKMDRAVDYYYTLKNNPRFKNSKVVQAWTKEFLSHPDLKALNDQWRRDHNPLEFLVGMVRSPNFQGMAKRYLAQGDMRAFVSDMATAPAVLSSAGTFMANDTVKGAVTGLNLLPGSMPDSAAALDSAKASPALRAAIEGSSPPPGVQ